MQWKVTNGSGAAWLTLGLLILAAMLNFIDRQILSFLVKPIKEDFGLSDVQISVLQGPAFAVLYAMSALPFGMAVDRFSRRRILALGIAGWSLMTMLCGLARSYLELALARMGVGVTEASLGPTAHSLIADSFDRTRLPFAMSLYGTATSLGSGVAFILGSQVAHWTEAIGDVAIGGYGIVKSWQLAFLIVGVPGLLLALATLVWLPEPPRQRVVATGASEAASAMTLAAFFRGREWLCIAGLLAIGLKTASGYAILSWIPTYFGRVYGWSGIESGITVGLLILLLGVPGSILAGMATSALVRRGMGDASLVVIATTTVVSAVFMGTAFVAGDSTWTVVLLIVPYLLNPAYVGLGPAMIQAITPGALRGRVSGINFMATTLVGMSLGPVMVALLTDRVFGTPESIGLSLSITTATLSLAGAALLWSVRPAYRAALDVASVNAAPRP